VPPHSHEAALQNSGGFCINIGIPARYYE